MLTAVNSINFDYGVTPHAIKVTFDSSINPSSLSASDLFVRKVGSDSSRVVASSFTLSLNTSNTIATFTYNVNPNSDPHTLIPDGDYLVDLFKDDVLDAQNQPLSSDASSSFFSLFADLSGTSGLRDRTVNASDASYVQSKIGTANPTYGGGDVDGDHAVTIDDKYFVMDYYDTKLITPIDGLEGLTATPTNGTNVRLTWARKSTTNTGFRIQRSTDGGRTFTTIVSTLAATTESYVDTTANISTTGYVYRVRSIEPNQPFTSPLTPTPSRYFTASIAQNATGGGTAVAPPTNLTVTSVGKNTITLGWTDTSSAEVGVEVYRSDDGGVTYRSVKYLQVANSTSWTDSGLKADKQYFYVVRSRSTTATSNFSDVTNGTTLSGAPSVIKANVPSSGLPQEIVAEFDQPVVKNVSVLSEAHVAIYSLTGGRQLIGGANGEFTVVDSVGGEIVRAKLNGVLSGSGILANGNYEITVRGDAVKNAANQTLSDAEHPDLEGVANTFFLRGDFNRDRTISFDDLLILAANYGQSNRTHAQGDTNFDGTVDFDDLLYLTQNYQSALPAPLTSVSQLTATTAVFSDPNFDPLHRANVSNAAYLEWTSPSDLEGTFTGYMVWRSLDSVNFGSPIATLPITQLNYIDRDLVEGERYTYRVRPYRTVGAGIEYGTSTNKAGVVPTLRGPTNVSVEAKDSDRLDIHWTDNSFNEREYRVMVFNAADELVQSVTVGANFNSATITGLSEAMTYSVRVSAWTPSAINHALDVDVTTRLEAPTNVEWTQLDSTSYRVNWKDNSAYESGYTIRWFADSDFADGSGGTVLAGTFVNSTAHAAGTGANTVLSIDITGLAADADVTFDVTAESGVNTTTSLTSETVSTLARAASPQAVTKVDARAVDLNNQPTTETDSYKIQYDRLKVIWADGQSNVSHYYVWMISPQRALLGVVPSKTKNAANAEVSQSATAVGSFARGPMMPVAAFGKMSYNFVATALDPMQSYTFAVQPEFYNAAPVAEKSSNAASTGIQPSGEAVGFWSDKTDNNSTRLRWNPIKNASARFELSEKGPDELEYSPIGTFGASANEKNVSGLRDESTYEFRLRTIYHGDRYVDQFTSVTTLNDTPEQEDERGSEPQNVPGSHLNPQGWFDTNRLDELYNLNDLVYEYNEGLGWYGERAAFSPQEVSPVYSPQADGWFNRFTAARTQGHAKERLRFRNEYWNKVIWQKDTDTFLDPWIAEHGTVYPAADISIGSSYDKTTHILSLSATPHTITTGGNSSATAAFEIYDREEEIWWPVETAEAVSFESFDDTINIGLSGGTTFRITYQASIEDLSTAWWWSAFIDWGSRTSEKFGTVPDNSMDESDRLDGESDSPGDDGGDDGEDDDDDDDSRSRDKSPRPSGLTILERTDTSIKLRLRDNSKNEQGIEVERSRDGVHWSRVKVLSGRNSYSDRNIEFVDENLTPGVKYAYRARAFKWTKTNEKLDDTQPLTDSNCLHALEYSRWSVNVEGTTDPRVGVWAETRLVSEGQPEMGSFGLYRVGEMLTNQLQIDLKVPADAGTTQANYAEEYTFTTGNGLPFEAPAPPPIYFTIAIHNPINLLNVNVSFADALMEPDEVIPLEVIQELLVDHTYEPDRSLSQPSRMYIRDHSVDIDLDSDNNNGIGQPDRSAFEDSIEMSSSIGKALIVNNNDDDKDGLVDFADFNNPDEKFTPIVLAVPPTVDRSNTMVSLAYLASDPSQITRSGDGTPTSPFVYTPATGHFRVWKKQGSASRSATTDYVPSATFFYLSDLGFDSAGKVTLWIEGVAHSSASGFDKIKMTMLTPSVSPSQVFDEVKLTSVKVEVRSSTAPYNGAPDLSNLLAAWPDGPGAAIGSPINLAVHLSPSIGNLPGSWNWNPTNVIVVGGQPGSSEIAVIKTGPGTGSVTIAFPGLSTERKLWIEFPDVGEWTEEFAATADPAAAAEVLVWAERARNYAASLTIDGHRANAIQHSYWNALVTHFMGASYAAFFTTAHEHSNRIRDGGLAADSVMDLYNNASGRNLANGAVTPGLSWDAWILTELNAAAYDGRLWIINNATFEVIRSDGKRVYA